MVQKILFCGKGLLDTKLGQGRVAPALNPGLPVEKRLTVPHQVERFCQSEILPFDVSRDLQSPLATVIIQKSKYNSEAVGMGFIEKILGKDASKHPLSGVEAQGAPMTVCAPFTGTVVQLKDIPDPVFSQGILGPGCGLIPTEEVVYAPFDGTISRVTGTSHAVGVLSEEGVELLIHVGIDTVDMNGKGFSCLVKEGQTVKAGEPLMTFTIQDIEAAGRSICTALVLNNSNQFNGVDVLTAGEIQHGAPLMKVQR